MKSGAAAWLLRAASAARLARKSRRSGSGGLNRDVEAEFVQTTDVVAFEAILGQAIEVSRAEFTVGFVLSQDVPAGDDDGMADCHYRTFGSSTASDLSIEGSKVGGPLV